MIGGRGGVLGRGGSRGDYMTRERNQLTLGYLVRRCMTLFAVVSIWNKTAMENDGGYERLVPSGSWGLEWPMPTIQMGQRQRNERKTLDVEVDKTHAR